MGGVSVWGDEGGVTSFWTFWTRPGLVMSLGVGVTVGVPIGWDLGVRVGDTGFAGKAGFSTGWTGEISVNEGE